MGLNTNSLHPDKMNYWKQLFSTIEGRPQGRLINGGHIHLGRKAMSDTFQVFSVDIEADVEYCGLGLRVIITEGSELRYTTRLTQIGQVWFVADKFAKLNVGSKGIKLRDLHFSTPQQFARFIFDSLYKSVRHAEVVTA